MRTINFNKNNRYAVVYPVGYDMKNIITLAQQYSEKLTFSSQKLEYPVNIRIRGFLDLD